MRIYLSHAIRGAKGQQATDDDMRENCNKALRYVEGIRKSLSMCPLVGKAVAINDGRGPILLHGGDEFYVPAEHEDFVQLAYRRGYLTEKQILEIDCEILGKCDAVFAFGPISGGMRAEIDHAKTRDIPVFYVEGEQCPKY